MSETRVFQTETRPRREVSTSRETENETRREIKQFDLNTIPTLTMSETRLFLSLLLSLSLYLFISLARSKTRRFFFTFDMPQEVIGKRERMKKREKERMKKKEKERE